MTTRVSENSARHKAIPNPLYSTDYSPVFCPPGKKLKDLQLRDTSAGQGRPAGSEIGFCSEEISGGQAIQRSSDSMLLEKSNMKIPKVQPKAIPEER